jgi:hypothetical protein
VIIEAAVEEDVMMTIGTFVIRKYVIYAAILLKTA